MAEPLDLNRILSEHANHFPSSGSGLYECDEQLSGEPTDERCLPYRLASELAEARAALQRVRKGQSLRRDFCTCKEHGIGGVFDASGCPLHDPHRKV